MADFKVAEGVNTQHIVLENQSTDPVGSVSTNVVFFKSSSSGGTGIWFRDSNNDSEELISKSKAMALGLVL